MSNVPSPLFIDPVFNGAADPMIIKNEQNGKFYMFYTQRRASEALPGSVSYCYGCTIGVAEAEDGGLYWFYRGALSLEFEFGLNTFWAPEIIWDKNSGLYHMFVSYIRGVHYNWHGKAKMHHYTSTDLLHWEHLGQIDLLAGNVIDPCIYELPDGKYRMWYKNEDDCAHTYYADSSDLAKWEIKGKATFDSSQEGPNVFSFGGKYWLVADEWHGQAVYSSDDLTVFTRQDGERLLSGNGTRRLDRGVGRHADVLVNSDRAFIVYFVHYNDDAEKDSGDFHPPTVIQLSELEIKDGKLVCDRNKEFSIDLNNGD